MRPVAVLCLVAAALVLIGGAVLYAVNRNHSHIGDVVGQLRRVERRDRDNLRRAALRICARENLTRAAIHSAYQQKQPPADPALLAREPVLAFLLGAGERTRSDGLRLVRRNLPILDCRPNLAGKPAVPWSIKTQARYVARYLANRLDPTPGDNVLPVEQR